MDAQVVAVSSRCTHLDLYLLLKQVRPPEFAVVDTSDGLVLLGAVTRRRAAGRRRHNPRRRRREFTPGWCSRPQIGSRPALAAAEGAPRHAPPPPDALAVALPAVGPPEGRGSGEVHRPRRDSTISATARRRRAPEEAAPARSRRRRRRCGGGGGGQGGDAGGGSFRSPTPNTPPPGSRSCAPLSQAEISLLLLPVDFGVDWPGPRGFSVINLRPPRCQHAAAEQCSSS